MFANATACRGSVALQTRRRGAWAGRVYLRRGPSHLKKRFDYLSTKNVGVNAQRPAGEAVQPDSVVAKRKLVLPKQYKKVGWKNPQILQKLAPRSPHVLVKLYLGALCGERENQTLSADLVHPPR